LAEELSNRASDQLLVDRVNAGEKHAFDLLVLKYQHKIINLIMRYVKNPTEALDVSQDAFLKAYRALPGFRGDSAFYTWMYRIAINTAKNHLVAAGRRPLAQASEISQVMECPVGTVRSRIFRAREAIDKNVRPIMDQV
jgi:DNA-directed RNA polymerase specialized sigma24 family protein